MWRWEGEAFGQTPANEDPDGDGNAVVMNLRFPGQYYDQETGLHYNWNRYYDAVTGKYITSDPIGLFGGLNTYLYANANPLKFFDSNGLLFGLPAGESFGDSAAQYWADRQIATGNPLYAIPGSLAALWTPDTSNATASTLSLGYAARLFGPFSPTGTPRYLQRLRKYLRFDRPHHGKGYEFDGTIPKWIRDKFKDSNGFIPIPLPDLNSPDPVDQDIQDEFCRQNPSAPNCMSSCQ